MPRESRGDHSIALDLLGVGGVNERLPRRIAIASLERALFRIALGGCPGMLAVQKAPPSGVGFGFGLGGGDRLFKRNRRWRWLFRAPPKSFMMSPALRGELVQRASGRHSRFAL